jgi:cardiolipin synthase A/B
MNTRKWFIHKVVVLAFVFPIASTLALEIDVADCPKSNLALTLQAINSAKKSILMNAYELTSPEISKALIRKIKAGVRTEILLEGQPCCTKKISAAGEKIKKQIIAAMEEASENNVYRFYLMSGENKSIKRRFVFNHAKYIIVDEEGVLISSENYTSTGNPVPGTNKGNRGWQTLVHDSSLAQAFTQTFREDSDEKNEDVEQLVEAGSRKMLFDVAMDLWQKLEADVSMDQALSAWASNGPVTLSADNVERLTSPTTSLTGLTAFIRSAQKTLDLELMSFNARWGNTTKESPLMKEIIAAARRGVRVRVLLNDENVFKKLHGSKEEDAPTKTINERTVDFLDNVAEKENLRLEAYIADIDAMNVNYIHNKGVLADGYKTLVSSINWNQNSVEKNRETAISISSQDIFDHYEDLFETDWSVSKRKHLSR